MSAKILMFDIETAPLMGWFWSIWKQNIGKNQIAQEWRMLTWAAKWLGDPTVHYDSCHLHKDHEDDYPIVASLRDMLDEADIVVAHNGNKFDIKKLNQRMLMHGLKPPSPYRKIDTLLELKKTFAFTSNRLDAVGQDLGIGRKIDTGGFELWRRCMEGEVAAYEEMAAYNVEDVELLERLYLKLRPWMPNHPNLGVYDDREETMCPKCGSTNLKKKGSRTCTQVGLYQRYQCKDCGGWARGRYTMNSLEKRRSLVTNAAG